MQDSILKFTSFILLALVLVINSCKKETSCENCGDTNKPLFVNAGPDEAITLPTDSISLDGSSSSDPDGNISGYQWTKIAGPASFIIFNTPAARTVVKKPCSRILPVRTSFLLVFSADLYKKL